MINEHDATKALNRLEDLATLYLGDFIALVLTADKGNTRKVVLVSASNSAMNTMIQACRSLEIEADRSRIRALMVEQHFITMGFLRVIRRNSKLRFDFPESRPGSVGWDFLESLSCQIKKLLRAETGRRTQCA